MRSVPKRYHGATRLANSSLSPDAPLLCDEAPGATAGGFIKKFVLSAWSARGQPYYVPISLMQLMTPCA